MLACLVTALLGHLTSANRLAPFCVRTGATRFYWMRFPLHVKVMISYLVVVGLIAVPTYVYLRTNVPEELQSFVEQDLERQARTLAQGLAQVTPAQLAEATERLVRSVPQRVTVVAPNGRVLGDTVTLRSAGQGGESNALPLTLDNHGNRPEIQDALLEGRGVAHRESLTTGQPTLYVAVRFPAKGPPAGVVRLAMPTRMLHHASADFLEFFKAAGALALSGAVLLSLLAAVVVSRPLRRMAEAAGAFAAGDFGHAVMVGGADEIGDAARALADLAGELRSRLVQAGADRMTLRAVLDNLPCGVLIFDENNQLHAVNSRARLMLDFASVQDEGQRAHQLLEPQEHAAAIARVLATGCSEAMPLHAPWLALPLIGTWLTVAAPSGASTIALIVEDMPGSAVGRAPRLGPDAAWTDRAQALRVLPATQLCNLALGDLADLLAHSNAQIQFDLSDGEAGVVEVGGKVRRAVTLWLQEALAHSGGTELRVRGQWSPTRLRLAVWTQGEAWQPRGVAELLSSVGGSTGAERQGGATQAWIDLARA